MNLFLRIALILIALLPSSLSARPETSNLELTNGEIIEIEQFSKLYAGANDTWVLILNYVTDSIEDTEALKKKALLTWETFRPVVEEHGFKAAGITARKYVEDNPGVILETSKSRNLETIRSSSS